MNPMPLHAVATSSKTIEAPSDPIDVWLDAVTLPLRVDRDLQLEIRQELRSHLEESVATLRAAGQGESEARDEAIRALGDERELADQLWRANRRRIRLRALALWVARLVLPPVTAALVVFASISAVTSLALLNNINSSVQSLGGQLSVNVPWQEEIVTSYRSAAIEAAPADVRPLFKMEDSSGAQAAEVARVLVDEHPDDHALFAAYASTVALRQPMYEPVVRVGDVPAVPPRVIEPAFSTALAVLAEGERREPENAFYPLLASGLLFNASSAEEPDPSQDISRPSTDPRFMGKPLTDSWDRRIISDPARYERALIAFRRAVDKPYLRSYASQLARRRLDALPANRLADVYLRATEELRTLLPWLNSYHEAAKGAAERATSAALEGKSEEAAKLVAAIRRLAALEAGDACVTVDLLVAIGIADLADQAQGRIASAGKDAAGVEAAWASIDAKRDRVRSAMQPTINDDWRAHASVLDSQLYGRWTPRDLDPAPLRRAEYAAADGLSIAALSLVILAIAIALALSGGVRWLFRRRDARPVRLVIGWRRTLAVVGAGAVLPVGLYWGYTKILRLSGRDYGVHETGGRLAMEYAILAVVVIFLMLLLARRALRKRAAESPVPMPPVSRRPRFPRSRIGIIFLIALLFLGMLFIALGTVRLLITVDILSRQHEAAFVSVLLSTLWALLAYTAYRTWPRGKGAPPTAEFGRPAVMVGGSMFPILATAALVLSMLSLTLRWSETRDVRAVVANQPAGSIMDEVQRSDLKHLREELLNAPPRPPHPER